MYGFGRSSLLGRRRMTVLVDLSSPFPEMLAEDILDLIRTFWKG